MLHRVLNLEEAARHLHLHPGELERLARDGRVPAERRGGRLIFRLVDIDAWASRRLLEAEPRELAAFTQQAAGSAMPPVRLTDLLRLELIAPALPAKTRASVIREMVALVHQAGLVWDPEALRQTLEEREALCPTAVPGRVAFLHPRSPQPELFAESLLALGRTVQPIHFGAPDGHPTRLFFLLGCREDRLHLQTLARLCYLAQKTDLLAQLHEAPEEAEALLACVRAAEAAVASASRPG